MYQASVSLLHPHERDAYAELQACMPHGTMLMCKLGVADVLAANESDQANKHVDLLKLGRTQYFTFVVCDAQTLMPHGFIELYGHSRRGDEVSFIKDRLKLLRQLSGQAGFPMLVVNVANEFPATRMRKALSDWISHDSDSPLYAYITPARKQAPAQSRSAVRQDAPPRKMAEPAADAVCPSCGDTLHYRISRTGKYKGRVFHVCQSYPKCSHIRMLPAVEEPTAQTAVPQITPVTRSRQPV